jgi:carbonic anhydrase/acetyltransferase-like protein (isoleucine patch superfamily)
MIMGTPAKVVRALKPEEIERVARSAAHYVKQSQDHRTLAVRLP